jgi:hypothetical protein
MRLKGTTTMLRLRSLAAFHALALAAAAAAAQPGSGPLFPEPFRVEHHLVQEDGDGSRFVGEPVVDTYGGSWIVSQRPDGSRLIVDLVRREVSEVRAEKGVYWTVSFDRFAELQKRMGAAQGLAQGKAKEKAAAGDPVQSKGKVARPAADLVVTEVAGEVAAKVNRTASAAGDPSTRPGVRRLRVARQGDSGADAALEVWVDPSVRLTPAALAAVSSLEAGALAAPAEDPSAAEAPGRYLAAARAHAAGALPVRTVRPTGVPGGSGGMGQVEDVATKVERLERFPSELAEIPEGLRRVPHPLEAVVRFLEEDAERNLVMSGAKREDDDQP